jgi:hypothetical protein
MGTMYMINPSLDSAPYLWSAVIGAMGGYALSYLSMLREEPQGGAEEVGEGAPQVSLGPWLTPLPQGGGRLEMARGVGLSGSF